MVDDFRKPKSSNALFNYISVANLEVMVYLESTCNDDILLWGRLQIPYSGNKARSKISTKRFV